ncbi:hypothetical protein E2C01_075178 [Portunus trituberculatus]|uniref:Uncharacterized protein n=1 Tax=Portunus trituberculatus TaxID=210409 RepID=A0A5B7IEE9_PORTR|nr:hypothetical protein [Portunus trituberculatus]
MEGFIPDAVLQGVRLRTAGRGEAGRGGASGRPELGEET